MGETFTNTNNTSTSRTLSYSTPCTGVSGAGNCGRGEDKVEVGAMGIDMEGLAVATAEMGVVDTCMTATMARVAKAQEHGCRSLTCLHLASGRNGYASLIGLVEGFIMTFAHLSRSGSAGSNDQGK